MSKARVRIAVSPRYLDLLAMALLELDAEAEGFLDFGVFLSSVKSRLCNRNKKWLFDQIVREECRLMTGRVR